MSRITTAGRRWLRWHVGPLPVIIETLILYFILRLGLDSLANDLPPRIKLQGVMFLCWGCGLLAAIRLNIPPLRRQVLSDGIVALALGSIFSAAIIRTVNDAGLFGSPYILFAFIIILSDTTAFAVFRVGVYIWRFWDRRRRQHLVWALTHAHMMVVIFLYAIFVVVGFGRSDVVRVGLLLVSSPAKPSASTFARVIIGVMPVLTVITFLVIVALVVILPPSAIFSYFVMRRTTRRLETLAAATRALRAKDYSVRINIAGEDEVANLQGDFNGMASELEQAMNDLRNERDTVTRLLQSRRDLVANVSHELRTPVATLRALLESAIEHGDAPSRHDLEIMERDVIRLQDMIDDLFSLSRAEVQQLTFHCQPASALEVIQRVVDSIAPLAWRSSRVEIIAEVPPDMPLLLVDSARLEQILRNLLRNGLQHTPSGGVITVSAAAQPDGVTIEVWDTGEGINPDDVPHIWERFYRGEQARARDNAGAGLGLALVKELTEAMNGSVAVESTPGSGSRFMVQLPRSEPPK